MHHEINDWQSFNELIMPGYKTDCNGLHNLNYLIINQEIINSMETYDIFDFYCAIKSNKDRIDCFCLFHTYLYTQSKPAQTY